MGGRLLELVVGQAATILQTVGAHFAGELLLSPGAGLRGGVGGQSILACRGVMNAIAAQQFRAFGAAAIGWRPHHSGFTGGPSPIGHCRRLAARYHRRTRRLCAGAGGGLGDPRHLVLPTIESPWNVFARELSIELSAAKFRLHSSVAGWNPGQRAKKRCQYNYANPTHIRPVLCVTRIMTRDAERNTGEGSRRRSQRRRRPYANWPPCQRRFSLTR